MTILALVRDATARLPNGEGTRADICQLLKDSQYIREQTESDDKEGYLHSVVSGALDRLHYETDPCVRYYPRRKEWLYLHRARSESEFGLYLLKKFLIFIFYNICIFFLQKCIINNYKALQRIRRMLVACLGIKLFYQS